VRRNGVVTADYEYDANGNRLSDGVGAPENADYDAQDRLLAYGDATYTYTPNGEFASKTDPSGTTT
jgi:YD repeat-containing protein